MIVDVGDRRPAPQPLLTVERLSAAPWTLSGPEGPMARQLRLQPDGRIAGWFNQADRRWTLEQGRLFFLDRYDCRSTVFDAAVSEDGVTFGLSGRTLSGAPEVRTLAPAAEARTLQTVRPEMTLHLRAPSRPRRNLVVLRANERSLHPGWARNIDDADRSWDLWVSFYGQPENFGRDDFAEGQVMQSANTKYGALYDLFHMDSPLWAYDYIAFPDDDLMTSWRDLNEMFAVCRSYDLLLAQPALTGHITHGITRPDPAYFLRFTSFVEPIAPWFSREALRVCAPTFPATRSAYGLDHVWPKLLGEPRTRMAIVDAVSVEHTRPVATSYDMNEALAEGWGFQMAHDAYPRELVYGGVRRTPVDHYLRW